MAEATQSPQISRVVRKWRKKRGNLIMALHELQEFYGYVPRDVAMEVASQLDVPMARIHEVLTFYNFFKLESPGDVIINVCTGTACHLKGAPELIEEFSKELGISENETTEDGMFHLAGVRCVGCCGLAPVVVVNGKTYGKCRPDQVRGIIAEWRKNIEEQKNG